MLLVTTAVEETWGDGGEVLFLGEWCKLYDRKHIWGTLRHETLPYHWDDRLKLRRDFERLQSFNDELLVDLTEALNRLHGVDHSIRYWRLVLGYWLNLFTAVLFDRWEMIHLALETGRAKRANGLLMSPEDLAANDSNGFVESILSDYWNQYIYQRILQQHGGALSIDYLSGEMTTGLNMRARTKPAIHPRQQLKRLARNALNRLARIAGRATDPLLINTYLSNWAQAELQVALGCVPQFPAAIDIPEIKYNAGMRKWALSRMGTADSFEIFVRSMIPEQLPRVFVEGFETLKASIAAAGWPRRPRFIFTACSHYTDDAFKVWAGAKVDAGTPFIAVEHGGFGSNAFSGAINYQLEVSDRSLSWGWEDPGHPQVKPFAIVKAIGKRQKWDSTGDALMVQVAMPRYSFDIRAMAISGQMLDYFEDQFRFYEALPEAIQSKLLVRLAQQDLGWCQKRRWQDRLPDVRLDDGVVPMATLIEKSRLYISTYNATTYLESLSLNVPTIMFWNPNHWELRDEAIPHFSRLKEVGIFHETPESAAAKVAAIWGNVPGWWSQLEIQEARELFCHHFARQVENPIAVLKDILEAVEGKRSAPGRLSKLLEMIL
ncbi:MAG: hypothetical protein IH604_07485 [Burkholderiales bacterium]|nr:hypothetical protein [Burkholderiales bacterium]